MIGIDLGPHFDRFVQEQIQRGRFLNASEVVRAGLRLLEEHETSHSERLAELKRQIDQAFDDPLPGVSAEEVFADLRRKHEARMKARQDGA